MSTTPKVRSLLAWCAANDIRIDTRLEMLETQSEGIAVYSREGASIDPPSTLVQIPKAAVLSVRSCSLSSHITQIPYGHGAHLSLALALLGELIQGESSRWFGYLQSLPQQVDIALLWGADDERLPHGHQEDEDCKEAQAWIQGTEVEKSLKDNESGAILLHEIDRYFQVVGRPMLTRLGYPASLEQFYHSYSLVSSRAFLVDAYHGLAMVPVADAFNHTQDNQVHLESDYDVCTVCGSLAECVHDEDPSTDVRPSSGETEVMTQDESCDMVSNSPILPGTEIFNTYGERLTNAQLLARYGFIIDGNEWDTVGWEFEDLFRPALDAVESTQRNGHERLRLWAELAEVWTSCKLWEESNLVYNTETDTADSKHVGARRPRGDIPSLGRNTLDKDGKASDHDSKSPDCLRLQSLLCVNSDGKISHQLWLYCALLTSPRPAKGAAKIPDLIAELTEVARTQLVAEKLIFDDGDERGYQDVAADELNDLRSHVASGASGWRTLVRGVADIVVQLCKWRDIRMVKARGLGTEELGEALDNLPASMTRTRAAMMQVLNERSLLESCMSMWGELGSSSLGNVDS